jgi:NADPH:quinone reductase
MQAVQFHEFGTPDVLRYESIPEPVPGAGEILIKVESASVNWSDGASQQCAVSFPDAAPVHPR